MLTIDARCGCASCEGRTQNIYRMVGRCRNCGTEPILLLFRAGDSTSGVNCPVCGNWKTVWAERLATYDEIPATEQPLAQTPAVRLGAP